MPPSYTAKATFLPPGSASSGSSALLGQLGQLGALAEAGGGLGGLKDPSLVYIGILESRTVADELIHQFNLQAVYRTRTLRDTEKALAKHTRFIPGKDTFVAVTVEDHAAPRAADMANAYLRILASQNDRLAFTEVAQRRSFFERQLEKEKNLLADAEVDLTKTEQLTGLIHPNGQMEAQISSIAETQAAMASREIELASLSQGETSENPDVLRLRSEIAGLKDQLPRLENPNLKGNVGNPLPPTANLPALTLEYVRKQREVKYHEALYELLLRQFESAKLDESRSAPLVQVVDSAVVPDTKSWPPRMLFILGAAFVAGIAGAGWVILRAVWATQHP
jgi:capsule polysaccharide export protein KpsE/RkpR